MQQYKRMYFDFEKYIFVTVISICTVAQKELYGHLK